MPWNFFLVIANSIELTILSLFIFSAAYFSAATSLFVFFLTPVDSLYYFSIRFLSSLSSEVSEELKKEEDEVRSFY